MTKEALKLALEALETERDIYREHDEDGAPEYILDAITSIKVALAQPAQEPYDQTALELCNVCGWKTLIPDDGCLNCERKAQPAQEPVCPACKAEVLYECVACSSNNYPPLPVQEPQYEYLIDDLAEWKQYVEVDNAPYGLREHVTKVLLAHGIKEKNK